MIRRLREFLDERSGFSAVLARIFDREMPAGIGWLHTLGSVCIIMILVLVLTGILLTLNYSPDPGHAYHSIRYIENEIPLGSLVRGLHYWSATILILVMTFHLLHTVFHFAFARPRELTWLTGASMLLVILAMGFTGYLLPWDEKAYWATVVGTRMAEQAPLIGKLLQGLLRGGADVGAATLSRFYGAHLTLLPLALATLMGLHIYLVVFHGISGKDAADSKDAGAREPIGDPINRPDNAEKQGIRKFWPDIVAMDVTAGLLSVALLFFLALRVGAPLGLPADSTVTSYVPRPEWYFLPLFKLLTLFPGSLEAFAAVGIPLVATVLLLSLPWWSRSLLDSTAGRTSLLVGIGFVSGSVVLLGISGSTDSSQDEFVLPPAVARGRLLFETLGCRSCHSIRGIGGIVGPDLALVGLEHGDTVWLRDQLLDPSTHADDTPMPKFPLEGERMSDLVRFLWSMGNDLQYSADAPHVFVQQCSACHTLGNSEVVTFGPDLGLLGTIRTVAYIHQYIEDPSSLNTEALMPPSKGLTHEQVEDVARYVVATALQHEWVERDN